MKTMTALLFLFLPMMGLAQDDAQTATTTKHLLAAQTQPQWVHFTPRAQMDAKRGPARAMKKAEAAFPITQLPVDCTANNTVVCPMYGNNRYGDCVYVDAVHVDQILTFSQGKRKQSSFDEAKIIQCYQRLSGGDNGLGEDDIVGNYPDNWFTGLTGIRDARIFDHLDLDPANTEMTRFCIDQFYHVNLFWSVPTRFINNFVSGSVWDNAEVPNPKNGHASPLTDVDKKGYYSLYTWGGYGRVSPVFVASVQPSLFVCFGIRQFDTATGLDSHGRHITAQNELWVKMGGKSLPTNVIAAFPPVGPAPPPLPPPPPGSTFTFTIDGYSIPGGTITVPYGLGRTTKVKLPDVVVPSKTVTGTINK